MIVSFFLRCLHVQGKGGLNGHLLPKAFLFPAFGAMYRSG